MSFYQIMSWANAKNPPSPAPTQWPLPRHCASTETKTAFRTGMHIDGQFAMFRNKNGQLVFISEDGQYIVK